MDDDYDVKLALAQLAYRRIMAQMKYLKTLTTYEINFCWDEYIIVDGVGFNYEEMQSEGVEPSRP